MSLTHLLTSGYVDMCPSPSSNIVCGVTGCGNRREGAEKGSMLLWGVWVCRAHGLAYERAIETYTSPLPPQQPCREKKGVGRGVKPSPAAMGVTIIDLAFMHAIATEGEKDKAAYVKIKGQMTSLQTENTDLRNELQKERVEILRLRKETERGTLERQVKEWAARAKTAEETCKTTSKASEAAVERAREGEKKARAEKSSFVKDLQKRMEIGGIQMYCIEKGSEGMFLPKTELHTQLEAWEKEVERAWEEVTKVKKELLRVAGELRQTQRTHKSLDEHAQALELVCSLNFKEGKTARLERDKLRDELKTQNLRQEKVIEKERGMLCAERKKADRLEVKLRDELKTQNLRQNKVIEKERGMLSAEREKAERLEIKMREQKAISSRREDKVEKFRLQAKRSDDRRRRQFEKDYSKV
jgi:hypothetical protein